MPTEETGVDGDRLRERGREYGTTTGRPRRCGWFDAVAARYAARINGLSVGALTLLDVLGGFEEIKVAVAYESPAGRTEHLPGSSSRLAACRPVYEILPGWQTEIGSCRDWNELPAAARALVERLEALVGVRFAIVSVGPDRSDTIIRDPGLLGALFD